MGLLLSLLLAQSVTPVQLRAGQDIARPINATKLADGGYVLNVYVAGQAAGAGGLTNSELRAGPINVLVDGGWSTVTVLNPTPTYVNALLDGGWTTVTVIPTANTTSGSLTASGQAVTLTTAGQSRGIGILITGTWTGTITFEASPDGSAWGTHETFNPITTVETTQTTTTTNGFFQPINLAGVTQVRARASAAMTGTATVLIVGSEGHTETTTMALKEPGTTAPAYSMLVSGSDGTNTRALKTTTDGTVLTSSYVGFDGGMVTAAQSGTWTVQPGNTPNTAPWLTTDTPRTVASANNTGTCTTVGVASVTVLASNANRKAYGIKASEANTVNVFCKLGATATTSNMPFGKGSAWSQDTGAVYTGVIDCISGSAAQAVCVYEFQ